MLLITLRSPKYRRHITTLLIPTLAIGKTNEIASVSLHLALCRHSYTFHWPAAVEDGIDARIVVGVVTIHCLSTKSKDQQFISASIGTAGLALSTCAITGATAL